MTTDTDSIVEKFNNIHNYKYDYSKFIYKNNITKIHIICPKHGGFNQTTKNHKKGKGCPKCGRESAWSKRSVENETLINNLKKVHGNKYDYSKVIYSGAINKIQIICKLHGDFYQSYISHKRGSGCPECAKKSRSLKRRTNGKDFFEKCNKIHNNFYSYKNSEYTLAKNSIDITCPIHGDFNQNAWYHSHGSNCPSCAGLASSLESFIKDFLNQYKVSFVERDRTVLKDAGKKGRELDFFIKDQSLAIECDGLYWHSELHNKNKNKNCHLTKLTECNNRNIKLIHIFENEIKLKPKIVKSRLKSALNLNKYKIAARKCKILQIDSKTKNAFLNKYHIQGVDKSSVKLGLYYKDRLVAVMTFCKNRKALGKSHIKGEWELSRYATIANFSIIGGAGKLLKYFERNFEPSKITSYADKRWSEGNLYIKLGFDKIRDSKPNYWYFKDGSLDIKHRYNFRKSILSKKLEFFNKEKTEWEKMKENGWNRIWDCGNMVFEKKLKKEKNTGTRFYGKRKAK